MNHNRYWEKVDKSDAVICPVFPDTEHPEEWREISPEEAVQYFGEWVLPPTPSLSYSNEILTAALIELTKDL